MTQTRLDWEAGQRLKKQGMERASTHATDEFKAAFRAAARVAARLHPEGFTSDDVVGALMEAGVKMPTEGRAIGPLMRQMVRDGVAVPTGRYVASRLASCHGTPRKEYRRRDDG